MGVVKRKFDYELQQEPIEFRSDYDEPCTAEHITLQHKTNKHVDVKYLESIKSRSTEVPVENQFWTQTQNLDSEFDYISQYVCVPHIVRFDTTTIVETEYYFNLLA